MDDAALAVLETKVKGLTRPDKALLTYYVVLSLTSLFLCPILLVPLYFHYHTLHYAFDDEGISMGYGILFRRELHLTYARMQDIHLSQNLFERWLGIGCVTVQTAGGGQGGDLRIKGVREFEEIRDYLYARMRGVRAGGTVAAGAKAGERSEVQILAEIRDELRATTKALAAAAGKRAP